MFDFFGILKGILIQNEVDRTKQLNIQVSPSSTTGTATTIVAQQTANRTVTLPDISGTLSSAALSETLTNKTIDGDDNTLQDIHITSLQTVLGQANNFLSRDGSGAVVDTKAVPAGAVVGTSDTQTLTNKSIDATTNTLSNIANASIASGAAIAVNKLAAQTASRAVATDGSGFLTPSATTATELGFVSGVTSSIQTQLNSKPTSTGSFTDNHVLRADGTSNVQDSNLIIDDSGNVNNVNALTTASGNLRITGNTVSSLNNTTLNLTTDNVLTEIFANRSLELGSPSSGNPGRLILRQDSGINNNTITLSTGPTLTGIRTFFFPDASTTGVGTDATQTLSNKTFSDATTHAQVATPANPSAGFDKLYFKSDNNLYSLSSGGTETQISGTALINPMTTSGDTIYGGASGAVTRLAGDTSNIRKVLSELSVAGVAQPPTWFDASVLSTTSKTTTYTALVTDDVIFCSGSAFTVTLYAASGHAGKQLRIVKTDSSLTNIITIDGNASETIDGALTTTLNTQYEEVVLLCDGSNWVIQSRKCNTQPVAYTPTFTGMGSPSSISVFSWREGKNLCITGEWTNGTTTGSNAQFTLGFNGTSGNVTIDTTAVTASSGALRPAGAFTSSNTGGSNGYLIMQTASSTSNLFFSLAGQTTVNSGATLGTGTTLYVTAYRIPISGWKG